MLRKLLHFITRPGAGYGVKGLLVSILTFGGYKLVREVIRKWFGG